MSFSRRLAIDTELTIDAPACWSNTLRSFVIPGPAELPHNITEIPLNRWQELNEDIFWKAAAYLATPKCSAGTSFLSSLPALAACFLGRVRVHIFPVGATMPPSFKQDSIHWGVRIGIPERADRITFNVLDLETTFMIGSSFRFLADVLEEGTAAAVMQSRVFMGLKSFVILRMTFFPFSILHNESNILESLSVRLDVTACNVTLSVFDGFFSKERTEKYLVSARLTISSFDSRPINPLKPSEASGGSWSCFEDFPPPFFFAGVVVKLFCFFFAGFNLA
mmetsp:Transcript_24716/g.44647  ORF Transcript_24716/g.44647 Transcript_24716/m.44647 type:complete len:279 (-) Transcript_24716:249-1085(-)